MTGLAKNGQNELSPQWRRRMKLALFLFIVVIYAYCAQIIVVFIYPTHYLSPLEINATQDLLYQMRNSLEQYKRNNGSYPKQLKQLRPQYWPAARQISFQRVKYFANRESDNFLLYSAGTNGIDESTWDLRQKWDLARLVVPGGDDHTLYASAEFSAQARKIHELLRSLPQASSRPEETQPTQ